MSPPPPSPSRPWAREQLLLFPDPLPAITCEWTNWQAQMDSASDGYSVAPESCAELATLTTCDPTLAVVCAAHKCRCSRPISREYLGRRLRAGLDTP